VTSSDPLGRRSLFWAGSSEEERDVREIGSRPLGRHAFYSGDSESKAKKPKKPKATADTGARRFPAPIPVAPVVVECSKCKVRSEVSVPQFLALHLPFWLWRPGRGYARLMTCPACRRRAWLSATWRPFGRSSD
jgi:hypothetical protein